MLRDDGSRSQRLLVLVLLGVFYFASPTEGYAASGVDQCHVCTETGECPLDPHNYDAQCRQWCGQWTYGGACWDHPTDESNPCGLANAFVVCYEPS